MYLFFEVFRHSLRTEEGAKIRFENIFFDLEKYKKFLKIFFFSLLDFIDTTMIRPKLL